MSLETQAVYISGNNRDPFRSYMQNRDVPGFKMDWEGRPKYPVPDYMSSRKRLAAQLIRKGEILKGWGKKQAVAIQSEFFTQLPDVEEIPRERSSEASLAWLVYGLRHDAEQNAYHLFLDKAVYCEYEQTLARITTSIAEPLDAFMGRLEKRLKRRLSEGPGPLYVADQE